MPLPITAWLNMSDECALCGCNGAACSACDRREEPVYIDEEIPQELADSLEEAGRFA